MKRFRTGTVGLAPVLLAILGILTFGCADDYALTEPEGLVLAGKGQGGGGGNSGSVTIDMSGGFEAVAQMVDIVSDNKKRTELAAGFSNTAPAIEYTFTFSDKVEDCSFDPADMSDADKNNLLAHLDDPISRLRIFSAVIEKDGSPKTFVKAIYNDDSSQRYAIQLSGASAAQGPTDHYVISGGTVSTLKDGFGQRLRCTFTGEQQLIVTR